MTESTEKEMKFIEGVDLDEKNVSVEYDDVIEYEISDNASLLYSKNKDSTRKSWISLSQSRLRIKSKISLLIYGIKYLHYKS